MSTQATIAFIGAGNMAASLIGGLRQRGYPEQSIWATRRNSDALAALAQRFSIQTTTDNITAVNSADVVVLAVKPHCLHELCNTLRDHIQAKQPLIISIVAGVTESSIQQWLGGNLAIVRCMPNTPALIGCSASALYANQQVSLQQRDLAESIIRAVGMAIWLDNEEQLHTVTALSGGGPAYIYLFMQALIKAAITLGLSQKTAELLTLQTVFGAAKLALESDVSIADLRAHVTSPQGTTEQAINLFNDKQLADIVQQALSNAAARSMELSEQFTKQNSKE